MGYPISDKQHAFALRLLSERLATLGLDSIQEARKVTGLDDMSSRDAKTFISRLLDMPKDPDPNMPDLVAQAERSGFPNNRPGVCPTCSNLVTEGSGYYFLQAGTWEVHHRKGECPDPDLFDAADEQPGIDLSHVPSGLYAVPGDPDRLKVKIDHPTTSRWKGWTFVNDAAVYGWQGRLGKVKPGELYVGKAMDKILAIALDPIAAMAEYGHITGSCGKCGKPLEDETSVARGIGPVCWKRMHE